jgi:hypothetical protein
MNVIKDYDLGAYNANLDKTVRFIRIGCETQNNLFSINEIQSVIDAYNEINK